VKINFGTEFPKSVHHLVVRNWNSPDSLFGPVDSRKSYSFEQAQAVFKAVWNAGLENAIKNAPVCSFEIAHEQIEEENRLYLKPSAEHRSVNYRGLLFVVQLISVSNEVADIDQIWFIHSHDKSKIILCASFKSLEDRDIFHVIAKSSGYKDGRDMIQTFVNNILAGHRDKNS
jgi:hypothetical protein